MRIFVTGGSGKIGTYVLEALRANSDHKLTVFDRVPPPKPDGIEFKEGNIEDFGQTYEALDGAEAVIHLAAIPVPGGVPDHVLFRTNLLGTYHIHEACYRRGIKRVVSTSSGAVLGWAYAERELTPRYLPIDEHHPLNAHDVYGLAKLCGEEIARAYALKCDMETIVFRPPWVLFPEPRKQLKARGGREVKKFDTYAYVDVRDLAQAYRQAVELPHLKHEVFFIAADDSTTLLPLSELLPPVEPTLREMARALEGNQSALSNEKAKRVLKWRPRYSWRDAD